MKKFDYIQPTIKTLMVAQEKLMVDVSGSEIGDDFEEGAKEQFSEEPDQIIGGSVWED